MTNEEIAVKLQDHENEIKSLKHRMQDQEEKEKSLTDLTTSVRTLAVNMEYMAKEQQKQGERLERLEKEPSEKSKFIQKNVISCLITSAITIVITSVVTFILSGGLKV